MGVLSQRGNEMEVEMRFPVAGLDLRNAWSQQKPRPIDGKSDYRRTTPLGTNVRGFEAITNRARGGSRPGLDKWINARVGGLAWIVQGLDLIVGSGYSAPGGGAVASASGRVVTAVAVSQGNVYVANAGDSTWTAATNNTGASPPLIFTGRVFSDSNQQKLYFADGSNYCYYRPSTNSVEPWTASAGSLPVDSAGNTPRHICTWRGRTVLSGLPKDQQNWFMSRVNDPTNWDVAPESPSAADAVDGNDARLGKIGDMVTGLVPLSDDELLVGGDSSLWRIAGDPAAGGSINVISEAIGMAWGKAWCTDPHGTAYFVSNRTGIYSIMRGGYPQRISQAIEQLLQEIDTGAQGVRLIWDDRYQGLHVFVTTLAAPTLSDFHFFYEQRTGAWWMDSFANKNHNPICCVTFDGNDPTDRVPLVGSWDGYVRFLSATAEDDDGTPIESRIAFGPFLTPNLDMMSIRELQAVLGEDSNDVDYAVLAGTTAEAAIAPTHGADWNSISRGASEVGIFTAGRNLSTSTRVDAHALYVLIDGDKPWAAESIRARILTRGKVQSRGY